jgi:hypothetical protein
MTHNPRSISVTGTGSAEAVPDLLTLSVGVECRRDTVAEAYGDAGTRSAAITSALRQHGVDGPDMSTSGLNVRAEVNWQEGRGQTVTGYLASSTLTIRIRTLSASSEVIAGFGRHRGPGAGSCLAGCPHHRRALRRPLRDRPGQGSFPHPAHRVPAAGPGREDAARGGGGSPHR